MPKAKPRPASGNEAGLTTEDATLLLSVLRELKKGNFSVRMPVTSSGMTAKLATEVNDLIELNQRNARNLSGVARVIGAVAEGDLFQTMDLEMDGRPLESQFLRTARTVNSMVRQLRSFTSEVTRVAEEVGTEGKLGGQARVKGVAGVWKDLTDNVNSMASNLTAQVRSIAEVTTAVATGDLSKKITVDVRGEILELKNTINVMVDQLNAFASEVTRVAREVGTEGKLGGQAQVRGVGGVWKDLTENVNFMAGNLTAQVRNIADVTTAVAKGDLSKKITVDVQGEILELKDTINVMVDQLNAFAGEVTRVAREVGTEGRLGGQAQVEGVAGVWKDLTDNVNYMAGNLTSQVRNIAEVTTAVANGDLSKKITVDVRGEILQLKDTINVMVDQLNAFAGEVTRVAREVGTEGKLGGQATVKGVGGVWKDLTDNVNLMAGQLTNQIRNIADVTTAVANGDLSKKITVDVQGEILELKNTINTMVDQLNSFASEVTRVAREVGTEGKLGGQAEVRGVGGTWKDLTDNVNTMAGNLTSQVRNIAEVTTAVANGDISKKITVEGRGEILELKDTINTMVDQLNAFASEVTRVAREVGTEGKLGGQAQVKDVGGVWKDLTDNVNLMAGQLTEQVRGIARVVTAVANGDLSKKITVDAQGEIAELKNTTNTMVDQLNAFASEVTRVAREVGTEGKLGGQAQVKGVAGTWKDLTDNVNLMAANLTEQVRGIARVVTAVANGDLKRKLAVEAKGEVAELGATINEMTATLAIFADQVTTVAREVGVEGKLGGQASVPGASGTWKDLTDNVNQLAANLTTQLRAIADVATSVTEGDLNREIGVAASGEVAVVKDKINQMIVNLAETTQKNAEQDWLKTNLARFTRVLQGQRDLMTVSKMILSELAPLVSAQHGVFYTMDSSNLEEPILKFQAGYAYKERKNLATVFRVGEGLVGQCALEKERILLTGVPDDYVKINSALGESSPLNIIVLPVLFEGQVRAVIELASFDRFSAIHQDFLDQLTESIGIVLNTIEANMTTESLLKQSQSLAHELQSQQEELQKTNEELEQKARLLAEQNTEVERKNLEVEQAKRSLEEKAEQLEITSRYKSEFLANMSHELRTPLNSLLILAQQLSDNPEGNLSEKQVEFAHIIRSSGQDLLSLINDILDLSKIESGTVALEIEQEKLVDLYDFVERTFRHIADAKKLRFGIALAPTLPQTITTDSKRLQQVLKNLLSNAFKFTEKGSVDLRITLPSSGWSTDHASLKTASSVIAFEVVDTGIGIPGDKQRHIFEAFQQADGSTARKYGGTGLGLSISRELVRLLGGEIKLESEVGSGTTFTVYLPVTAVASKVEVPDFTEIDESRDNGHRGVKEKSAGLFRPGARSIEELPAGITDDRHALAEGDRTVLILEDDPNFAKVLLDLAHQNGFKGLIALHGETALLLARQYRPTAITLDLGLRDMSGWAVLDRLKHDPETAEIPVHIISVFEDGAERGMTEGASTYLTKPVGKETLEGLFARVDAFVSTGGRKLLVIEDDAVQRQHILETVGQGDVEAVAVGTGKEALNVLRHNRIDCVVLDLGLPDIDGHKLIDQIHKIPGLKELPIIVYTAAELSVNNQARLRRSTKSIIQKTPESSVQLADEVGSFFNRVREARPVATAVADKIRPPAPDLQLSSHKALVVDDDVRNIFALTALLERQGMQVVHAESGREAIQMLHENPSIEVVLMDIMMPGMDGYETMSTIRRAGGFEKLPIIALTAKAMKGDREKCLEAGASDYIAKPVDPEQLLGLLRSWLQS